MWLKFLKSKSRFRRSKIYAGNLNFRAKITFEFSRKFKFGFHNTKVKKSLEKKTKKRESLRGVMKFRFLRSTIFTPMAILTICDFDYKKVEPKLSEYYLLSSLRLIR